MPKIINRKLSDGHKLTQEERKLIQSHVVYEKSSRDEILKVMNITGVKETAYVDECFEAKERLQKAWGLYECQFVGDAY
jgi:hypothetical protein